MADDPAPAQPAKKKAPAKKKGPVRKVAGAAVKATPQGRAGSVAAKAVGKKAPAKRGVPGRVLGKVPQKARRWLLAEFVVCVLLLLLGGMTGATSQDGAPADTGSRMAVKGSAVAGVFVVLGLVSAGGPGAQKAAGALGALITLAYMFNERQVFTTLSDWARGSG